MLHLVVSIHQLEHLNLNHKHQCLFQINSNHQLKHQHSFLNKTHLFQIKVNQKCTIINTIKEETLTKTCQDKTTIITILKWDNNNLSTKHHHHNITITTIKEETSIKVETSIKDRISTIKVEVITVACTKTKTTIIHIKVETRVITKIKIKVTTTRITNKRDTITIKVELSNINQETSLINGNHLNLSYKEKNIKIER